MCVWGGGKENNLALTEPLLVHYELEHHICNQYVARWDLSGEYSAEFVPLMHYKHGESAWPLRLHRTMLLRYNVSHMGQHFSISRPMMKRRGTPPTPTPTPRRWTALIPLRPHSVHLARKFPGLNARFLCVFFRPGPLCEALMRQFKCSGGNKRISKARNIYQRNSPEVFFCPAELRKETLI